MTGTDVGADTTRGDQTEEIHVANPTEGVFVFYTGNEDEYIRTDCVVDVTTNW